MNAARRLLWLCSIAVILLASIAACGSVTRPSANDPILVSAASSLTDVFAELARTYEAANPKVEVNVNAAGSSTLRTQIVEGAPVDVFASADTINMDAVVAAGAVTEAPTVFATNRLQIAVPAGNPGSVLGLADFAQDELFTGLCAAGVPCGDHAREILAGAQITPAIDTNEANVRALLAKVEAGELDIGMVYVTDVKSARGSVDGIAIPEAANVVVRYPIAVLEHASDSQRAKSFVEFVLSPAGQAILSNHGFLPRPKSQ